MSQEEVRATTDAFRRFQKLHKSKAKKISDVHKEKATEIHAFDFNLNHKYKKSNEDEKIILYNLKLYSNFSIPSHSIPAGVLGLARKGVDA